MPKESRRSMRVSPLEAVLSLCIMLAVVLPADRTRTNRATTAKRPAVVLAQTGPRPALVIAGVGPASLAQVQSAAGMLEFLIATRGWQAGAAEYCETVADNPRYLAVETEFVTLGYRYLRARRVPEAVTTFEIAGATFRRW